MTRPTPLIQTKNSDIDAQAVLEFLQVCGERTKKKLQAVLDTQQSTTVDDTLTEAIRYSLFNGGKRIRPALIYATSHLIGLERRMADPLACAVELIHCYSLIHDDLPAMDDDDMRRGKPSCHRQFSEAIAILAGDAMQALAFECLSKSPLINDENKIKICQVLAETVGICGMASGQAMDILANISINKIEQIHRLKTGALMRACVVMPLCCVSDVPKRTRELLYDYADDIGLCFQIRDDIIDYENNASQYEAVSYITTYGREGSQERLEAAAQQCTDKLQLIGEEAQMLLGITHYITTRES